MKPIRTSVRAKVPQPYRELLHRYMILINTERHKRGLSPVPAADVAGAMICFVLDYHQQSIIDGYEELRTSVFIQKFEPLLGGARPSASGAAEVPDYGGAPGT